ncbi:MAG: alpha/beta hydrolase [Rhodospirillales bacterium]|nr:alpha/beta hydrolase [Alphaproteobacteria bacterium]MCB9986724.1 alpha/beta hydrolase [Rhodospirillales bacterium]USO08506.1 MAG: alpha/beta hydrolase [Rhodospirillales bacterium]
MPPETLTPDIDAPGFLLRPDGTHLPYDRFHPAQPAKAGPAVVFLHGLRSDRNATKALFLDATCRRHAIPFIRYDAYGHGAGPDNGPYTDFTLSRAVHDVLLVIDQLTEGPVVLMGSSMGGWTALRAMEERPDRVAALVGIATAPDFTAHVAPGPDYPPGLIADGPANFVMDEPWYFDGPVHLVQGQRDESVPWQTAESVAARFADPARVRVTLIPDGDHRLNRPEDLAIQESALLDVISRI